MTPEERGQALEALRVEIRALKYGQRIGYWTLMDLLDQGEPELSRALDVELHVLEKAGELAFDASKGTESIIERRGPAPKAKRVVKKKSIAAKKKPAPKTKSKSKSKPAPKKKNPRR